jgi:HK97 family phage portal protein
MAGLTLWQRAFGPLASALARVTLGRPQNIIWGTPVVYRGATPIDIAGQSPESLPSVYGCCALLADALVSLDWAVTAPAENGGRDVVTGNAAADTLERWRKADRWAFCWGALTSGNGVGYIHRDPDGSPYRIEVYPSGRAFLNLYSNGELRFQLAPLGGDPLEVPDDDVVHLRYRPSGAFDHRLGVSPLLTASPSIAMLLASRAGTTSTMLRASRPSGVLQTDGRLDPQRAQSIKDAWQQAHGEPGQRGQTAVLEQGLKFVQVDPGDLVKLASVETQSLGTSEICRLFSIPVALMHVEGSGARASAQEDRRKLQAFAVSPLARLIEDAIGSKLLTQRQMDMGLAVTVDTSVSLIGEGTEMAEVLSKLVNAGLCSVNEARAWIGYGSAGSEADALRAPTNTWPIEAWINAQPASADTTSRVVTETARERQKRAFKLITGGKFE